MSLLLLLLLLASVLIALLWGGSLLAQGYLYNLPADKLPVRAAIAGGTMALFLTFWCWLDKRSPDKYQTFFDFSNVDTKEYDAFDAVRMKAKDEKGKTVTFGEEFTERYQKKSGGKSSSDYINAERKPLSLVANDSVVVGVVVREKDAEPRRFTAQRNENGHFARDKTTKFVEDGTRSYMEEGGLGRVFTPRPGTLYANLFLNLFHFALWFALFWLVLQFTNGHALLLAMVFGLSVMLIVMPVLFQQNRKAAANAPPPAEVQKQP